MSAEESPSRSEQIHAFIREAELLKIQERTAWNSAGKRESVAEHSWRLALLVLAMEHELRGLDTAKLLRMAVVHDLGEAYDGDISAALQSDEEEKERTERSGVEKLTAALPPAARETVSAAWEEYARGESAEAQAVKAFDKIETIIQHNQGANPPQFDYRFNVEYGRKWAATHEAIAALRELVDRKTEERAAREQRQ